jgi:hypothetical protein
VAGADDAYGNLAAICDENFLEHFLERQRSANPRFYSRFRGRDGEQNPKPQRTLRRCGGRGEIQVLEICL